MPELPEVETTVRGLADSIVGLRIVDVWSDYNSSYFKGSRTLKDASFFTYFKEQTLGSRVRSVERRAKNILIHLTNNKTILIHMKMTGHLLYGTYHFDNGAKKDPWIPILPRSLDDPYNRHIHFVLTFDNKRHLALSDVRKFAKVTVLDSHNATDSVHLNQLGPEPLTPHFTLDQFMARLSIRPRGKIKQVIMDPSVISGVGNIYADESLWHAGIHPLTKVEDLSRIRQNILLRSIRKVLSAGIRHGGTSTSDYRNIHGEKGAFGDHLHVYRKTGLPCDKRGCRGIICRITVGGRGTHYCPAHQTKKRPTDYHSTTQ